MPLFIARGAVAAIIAISASVGTPNTQPATVSPEILEVQSQDIPASKEESGSAKINLQSTVSAEIAPPPISTDEQKRQEERNRRVLILQSFLAAKNSPMADNAQDFIDAAEQYNLDWKLLPSIAGVESIFGKHVYPNSYNPFGWGGGTIMFESWRDGIFTVAKGLSEKYVARGLDTPAKMQSVYAPPSHTWANKVNFFIGSITQSEQTQTTALNNSQ